MREQMQALMAEIGPIADLMAVGAFEDQDVWTLVVDDETVVDADLDRARGCLVLSAEVGPLPATGQTRWPELLLQYNYQWAETGGARLALAMQGGPVVLLADHPVAGLTTTELAQRLGLFLGLLRAWREILTRAPADEPGTAPGRVELGPMSGMIRA